MKLTLSWLKEYINVPYKINVVCDHLTMGGVEVDSYEKIDNDYLIDIDLTPNRSDCLSVKGIARELSCLGYKYKLKNKPKIKPLKKTSLKNNPYVKISSKKSCPKFSYIILNNININKKTPKNILDRLDAVGIKKTNIVVDVLNYIMIEIGQPMHAYDLDKIDGKLNVRFARSGETINGLDGSKYVLDKSNLVISDNKIIHSLAGILGSAESSISAKTKNILIESAYFDNNILSNKARDLKIQTESSHRFERGVDFTLSEIAIENVIHVLQKNLTFDKSKISVVADKNLLPKSLKVKLDLNKINESLGTSISNKQAQSYLKKIGCNVNKSNVVSNPSYRFDLNNSADYTEEIARIYGYNNILESKEILPVRIPNKNYRYHTSCKIKQYLSSMGFNECINYSFTSDDQNENEDWEGKKFNQRKEISNPLNESLAKMRSNLLGSLIKNIQYNRNISANNSYKFFEISKIYTANEHEVLTCVVCGDRYDEQWCENKSIDIYDLLSILDGICVILKTSRDNLRYHIGTKRNEKDNFHYLTIYLDHKIDKNCVLPNFKFSKYSKYPSIRRDISFLINNNIKYQDIIDSIKKNNVQFLEKIILFDMYEGGNIEYGKKSVALGFIFQANRTLTSKEVEEYISEVRSTLERNYNAEIRE